RALPLLLLLTWHTRAAAEPAPADDRLCSDPCFQAARADRRECTGSATGVFLDAVDGCLERDHVCVEACRSLGQDCRDSTGTGAALLACSAELVQRRQRCRDRHPIGSERGENCIDRAELAHVRCRREARWNFREALADCGRAFDDCTASCGPGG